MYYWNQDNFEGLLAAAAELRKTPELATLADYCELKEKGLRQQAIAASRAFVAQARTLPPERQVALALSLMDMQDALPQAYQFLNSVVKHGFIRPVLQANMDADDAARSRWVVLDHDVPGMRELLRRHPGNALVWRHLLGFDLNHANFAMHHLDESAFIGSTDACAYVLAEARRLLQPPYDAMPGHALWQQEYAELQAMFDDWMVYSAKPEHAARGTFPEWCVRCGRGYERSAKVYYHCK